MVGRALDREVERDLEPQLARAGDQAVEIVDRPQLGIDGGVAARLPADRPWAARVALRRLEGVVPPLAVRLADRVDRREVDDVEAEAGELGQHLLDALEPAPRARKELVPGPEAGERAVGVDLERANEPGRLGPVALGRREGGRDVELEHLQQRSALLELALEVGLPGLDLPAQLVAPRLEPVDPGLDRELPPPAAVHVKGAGPAVGLFLDLPHLDLVPLRGARRAVADRGAEQLVAVAEDRCPDLDLVADGALDRVAAAVELRPDVLDLDAGWLRLGNGHRVRSAFSAGRA